ncbi:MAG: SMC-Scp complex subunit ScpB, partial [Aeromicrobium sp.]
QTSDYFLERMGLASVEDLPELAPFLPELNDMDDEPAEQLASLVDEGLESPAEESTPDEAEPRL